MKRRPTTSVKRASKRRRRSPGSWLRRASVSFGRMVIGILPASVRRKRAANDPEG